VPDMPKSPNQSLYSHHPELSCNKGEDASCEVTFRKGKGFIMLNVKPYPDDVFRVEKCY
jgi:hypothetical protein